MLELTEGTTIKKFFRAYVKVDACLELCEKTSESSSQVRQTYAGIRFICVDHEEGSWLYSRILAMFFKL